MCVGPTRGLAERGHPFFRPTLLGGGVGVCPGAPSPWHPCTQPGGDLIALCTPPACQMAVRHSMSPWRYWVSRIYIIYMLLESIQSADAINLESERCASAGDRRYICVSAVFGLFELDNCPGNVRSLLV